MLRRRRGVWIRTSLYASSMCFLKVFEHSFDVVLIVADVFRISHYLKVQGQSIESCEEKSY